LRDEISSEFFRKIAFLLNVEEQFSSRTEIKKQIQEVILKVK